MDRLQPVEQRSEEALDGARQPAMSGALQPAQLEAFRAQARPITM